MGRLSFWSFSFLYPRDSQMEGFNHPSCYRGQAGELFWELNSIPKGAGYYETPELAASVASRKQH
jgi:hypothetical protein